MKFNFVTMGTPARYKWFAHENLKVLHLINHRGEEIIGGSSKFFMNTKSGDYIQQWGVEGSDMKSPSISEQKLNERLDELLGIGHSLEVMALRLKEKRRLPEFELLLL